MQQQCTIAYPVSVYDSVCLVQLALAVCSVLFVYIVCVCVYIVGGFVRARAYLPAVLCVSSTSQAS